MNDQRSRASIADGRVSMPSWADLAEASAYVVKQLTWRVYPEPKGVLYLVEEEQDQASA